MLLLELLIENRATKNAIPSYNRPRIFANIKQLQFKIFFLDAKPDVLKRDFVFSFFVEKVLF